MERRTFGRTGLEVSVVGFGGAPIGFQKIEQQQAAAILNTLLDEGVNLIDTAAAYEGSEEAIGKAVSHRRDEYVLVSKCGSPGSPESDAWKPAGLLDTVDRALKRLKTDHLDVMLLHSCGLELLQQGEAVGALVRAREAGKIRHVGYSGDNEAAGYAAALDDIAVLETSINICDQANIDAVLPVAREHSVGVIAKRPIANAAWKDLSEQPDFYQSYAATYTERLEKMHITPRDFGLEESDSKGWAELALRFTLSQPGVHTAIIGTTNPDHARANLAAAANGSLPDDAIRNLRSAFRDAQEASEEAWAGQT
jgi:aryl-alcohol dehydrogenase-like predicted oxidoreductase